ncbi:MAG: hypothetical protein D6744_13575 [Planctomycetota bacterium]|nr:MAG: hypothetical protein D6744_13575 [Planctomycetota bacterium]
MFALLEHTTADGVHWDLLVERPGCERLATWRLAVNPLEHSTCPATPIGAHRRIYLDYEGDIGGGRGVVRRIDRGTSEILTEEASLIRLRLSGDLLRGAFEIRNEGGVVWFARMDRPE